MKRLLSVFFIALFTLPLFAQDEAEASPDLFSAGADFVSRYYWRGQILADAACFQPYASLSVGGFTAQVWGSYSLDKTAATGNELDIYLSYKFDLGKDMTLTAQISDYYFPNSGLGFLNYRNHDAPLGPGAHTIDGMLVWSGPASFPLTLSGSVNIYNDKGNNSYFEASYGFETGSAQVTVFAGVTPGSKANPVYYGTDSFALVNIGATVAREIKVTDSFSVPVKVTCALNPKWDTAHIIVGFSL